MVSWQSLLDVCDRGIQLVAGGLVGLCILFMCVEIFLRAAFGIAHDWGYEVIQGGTMAGVALVAACLIRRNGHTGINILLNKLHGRKLTVAEILLSVITLGLCSFLCVSVAVMVHEIKDLELVSPTTLGLQEWLYDLPFLVALGFCVLFSLERLLIKTKSLFTDWVGK